MASKNYSKQKGARFEREIADFLKEFWGAETMRSIGSGAIHKGGQEQFRALVGDVTVASDDFPFVIECKNREQWDYKDFFSESSGEIGKYLEQVHSDAQRTGTTPLLIFTKNYADNYYTLPFKKKVYDKLKKNKELSLVATLGYQNSVMPERRTYETLTTTQSGFQSIGKETLIKEYLDFDWHSTEINPNNQTEQIKEDKSELKNIFKQITEE